MKQQWKTPLMGVALIASLWTLSLSAPAGADAAALPGKVTALPNPPGAPQRDVFLITLPKSHEVPERAIFHFTGTNHTHITTTESFRKLNQYQYETLWAAPSIGHVSLQVYTKNNQLVARATFPVSKAKTNVVGRVVLGAVFIGASLWFWYRQQRFYRNPR